MNEKLTLGRLFPNTAPPAPFKRQSTAQAQSGPSFQELLSDQLKLSHHAEVRLKQRGIQLNPEQMQKIGAAIDKAASKGAKDSLILMDSNAFIVNVKSRTIVTAMDESSMKDNVFTQIDSAIVIPSY
jgi:flagellar operon protein